MKIRLNSFTTKLFISNLLKGKPRYMLITIFIIIVSGIMVGRIFLANKSEGSNGKARLEQGDNSGNSGSALAPGAATENGWASYHNLKQEITSFARKISNWGLRKPNSKSGTHNPASEEEKYEKILSYRVEVQERLQLRTETLERLKKELEDEIRARMEKKEEQLKKEIETAIQDKKLSLARELAMYKKEIEDKYFLELTNLRFKLSLPGLPQEDIIKLEEKIEGIKEELKEKTEEKEAKLAEEAASFAKRRAMAGEEELVGFEAGLLYEMEVRYRQEKDRLEEDFLAWQRRKEKELEKEGADVPFS